MASRLKGNSREVKIVSNGVDRFVMKVDGEYRSEMRCPICHGVGSLVRFDQHLREHMGGAR